MRRKLGLSVAFLLVAAIAYASSVTSNIGIPDEAVWGTITGTLSAQDDLNTALNLKATYASPTFTGVATSPVWSTSGLTGAVSASRYAGATASAAPATGTFAVGDFVITQAGQVLICTVAGTPGTWVSAGTNPTSGTGITVTGASIAINTAVTVDKTTAQTMTNKTLTSPTLTTPTLTSPTVTGQSAFGWYGNSTVFANGNSGTTKTIDWGANGNAQSLTLTASCVLTFTAPANPGPIVFYVSQDATGLRAITWPATVKTAGGTPIVVTTTALGLDVITGHFDGTNYYLVDTIPAAH